MSGIVFRPYEHVRDCLPLGQMLQRVFHTNTSTCSELIAWKYQYPEFHSQSITWIAEDKGQIVGHYCNVPMPLRYEGQVLKSMMCLDMATDPYYRRQGIISHLSKEVYKKVEDDGYVCSFGFSTHVGVQVDNHASDYGYIVVDTVRQVRLFPFIGVFTKRRHTLHRITTFPRLVKPLDWRGVGIYKSAQYLQWRYIDKPGASFLYDIYEVSTDRSTIGYLIVSHARGMLRVMDWVPIEIVSDDEVVALIKEVAYIHHCIGITLLMYGKQTLEITCLDQGFRPVHGKAIFYLTVRKNTDDCPIDLLSASHWHGFGGDIV